jgi:endonuclease/exonuclease/phosphatase family metal-dependent hydrolase
MLAALMVLVGAVPGAALAAPATIRTMTFNVCGNVCRMGEVDLTTKNIAYQVRKRNIAVAMFQEMCFTQFLALRGRLAPYGYSAVFGNATTGGRCDGDSPGHGRGFGVAIVARGAMSGQTVIRLPNPYGDEPEQRVVLGVTVRLPGRAVFVATTHTTPRGPNLTAQLTGLRGWLGPAALVRPVLFGGDLNALPGSADLDGFYAGFREANDDRVNPLPTFQTGRKIDYLFGGKRYLKPAGVSTACSVYSDHCMYVGTFR